MAGDYPKSNVREVIDRFLGGYAERQEDAGKALTFTDEALLRHALDDFLADEPWLRDDESAAVIVWLVDQLAKVDGGGPMPRTILQRLRQEASGLMARLNRQQLMLDQLREELCLLAEANRQLQPAAPA